MSEKPLAVEEITVEYGMGRAAVRALDSVSLAFRGGRLTLVMGPSGSGKTTLLAALGCLLSPNRGRVFVMNQEVTGMRESDKTELRRRRIGYVFQAFRLFRSLTALENIRLALELSGQRGRRAEVEAHEALASVGLADKWRLSPAEMSGGEKQRVAIARALVNDPPIILADEPTASLDSQAGDRVAEMMLNLAERDRRLVVVVSHDHRWLPLCHRKVVLQNGRLVQDEEMKR